MASKNVNTIDTKTIQWEANLSCEKQALVLYDTLIDDPVLHTLFTLLYDSTIRQYCQYNGFIVLNIEIEYIMLLQKELHMNIINRRQWVLSAKFCNKKKDESLYKMLQTKLVGK